MSMLHQVAWGSLFLTGSLVLETVMLFWCIKTFRKHEDKLLHYHPSLRALTLLLTSVAFIILSHTMQVWLWASALMNTVGFADWNTALYFSLVTYTTLGYGDIILDEPVRIFAAFAAMTGMLAFGLSTSFLITVMYPMFRPLEAAQKRMEREDAHHHQRVQSRRNDV